VSKATGLRTEILMTLVVLLGAALFFVGLVMLRYTESSLLEERVNQLDAFTQLLGASFNVSTLGVSVTKRDDVNSMLPDAVDCRSWRLFDQELLLLESWSLSKGRASGPFPPASIVFLQSQGRVQRTVDYTSFLSFVGAQTAEAKFLVPLFRERRFEGALEIVYSLEDIKERVFQSQILVFVYILLYGLVLAGAGYFLLQRNIIKPAQNLLIATEAVGSGNLETMLPEAGPLEIRHLAEAYNRMVAALRKSRGETESHIEILKDTNLTLEQTRNELVQREKMASTGQLAAGLAHELGNPLAAVIGYLEILKQSLSDAQQRDIVGRSLVEATRIDFLVQELLNFSRPDERAAVENVDLVSELISTVALLQHQGALKHIDIVDQLTELNATVQINRIKLQQVFINLLLNAVCACDEGGQITLSSGCSDTQIWVAITDSGCGMDETELTRIFDPFYTTKEVGQGTGLGLTVCQRIIHESGGWIMVDSTLEQGSRFILNWKI
jgi:signal transduction histidine kinase